MSQDKRRRPRLIFNDDASNFLYAWDDLGAIDLREPELFVRYE